MQDEVDSFAWVPMKFVQQGPKVLLVVEGNDGQQGVAGQCQMLLDDMGCQAGVEPAKLTTVMKTTTETNTKPYATIKLGIDAHAKWYYVARQLDGATGRGNSAAGAEDGD